MGPFRAESQAFGERREQPVPEAVSRRLRPVVPEQVGELLRGPRAYGTRRAAPSRAMPVDDGFVRSRTQLINQARGFAKSLGDRLPSSSSVGFPKRVREAKKGRSSQVSRHCCSSSRL